MAINGNGTANSGNMYSGEKFAKSRNLIEIYSIVSLICLILAIVLLSFDARLPCGILIIAGATMQILVFRKTGSLLRTIRESIEEAST